MITNHITSSVDGINASYYTSLAETFGRLFILVLGLSMYYTLPIVYGLTSKRRTLLLCIILWQIWTLISSNHQHKIRVFVPTPLFKVVWVNDKFGFEPKPLVSKCTPFILFTIPNLQICNKAIRNHFISTHTTYHSGMSYLHNALHVRYCFMLFISLKHDDF